MAKTRTFENPILPGFQPDPSICRVGDDFYLVTSSFEYFPGVPIFHSQDLVHWRQLGHVLTRKSQLNLEGVRSSGGIYAPTLRHANGRFYLVTTHVDGGGNFFVTARRPEGPWSDPIWIDEGGFDPSLTFDAGRVYYLRDGPGRDVNHPRVHQAELDIATGKLKSKLRPIWSGAGGIWTEGGHLYARDGWYYLWAAEGGTSYGHSEVVARSRSPFGPFRGYSKNPILTHRQRRRHPIQATGHADFVELDDGSAWCVFLGTRSHKRRHHLGRETFLAPVSFADDGWPTIGEHGHVELRMPAPSLAPHPFPRAPERNDFDAPRLGPEWIYLRNPHPRDVSLAKRRGFLRVMGSPLTLDQPGSPAFIGRRQAHLDVTIRTELEFEPRREEEEAGIVLRANEDFYFAIAIRKTEQGKTAFLLRRGDERTRAVGKMLLPRGPAVLEIIAKPERYDFFVSAGGRRKKLGSLPSEWLSAEVIARYGKGMHFTGIVIGLYATGYGKNSKAPADFAWFEYRSGA